MNADEDHRCQRCGRRLMGTAVEAPPEHAIRALQAVGANALAAATAEMARPELPAPKEDKPKRSPNQPLLFGEEAGPKVIPFDRVARAAQNPAETAATAEMFPSNAAKPRAASKKPAAENAQAKLDFLPPAVQTTRVLKTTVEAAIYCDSPVATPMHRAMASALDAG